LLQIPSTSSRIESSLNSFAIDELELIRRLRDQIFRLKKIHSWSSCHGRFGEEKERNRCCG
jgi:hypothetical protein